MEFTHEQISEIISEITNGEQGLQGLGKQGFESLMLSERSLHNCSHQDVSNGYRDRRVCHEAQTLSHHSTLDDHNNRRQINNEINLDRARVRRASRAVNEKYHTDLFTDNTCNRNSTPLKDTDRCFRFFPRHSTTA